MALNFPNRSRSFDRVRNAVRFIGHDGMFEVPFFVNADALTLNSRRSLSESELLVTFDAVRSAILDVAREVYSHGKRRSYTLTASDFR